MMRVIAGVLFFLLLCSTQVFARSVYVLSSQDCCRYDTALTGVTHVLEAQGVVVIHQVLQGNEPAVLHDVQTHTVDGMLAIGSKAAEFLAAHVHAVPIVYTMVLNPSPQLLQARNVWGVALNLNADSVIQVLHGLNIEAEHVGVMTGQGARTRFSVQLWTQAAQQRHMQVDVWRVPDLHALSHHLDDFLRRHDAVVLLADRDMLNVRSFRLIAKRCRMARVPLFVPSRLLVRFGALASFSVDAADVGEQAANLLLKLWKSDKHEAWTMQRVWPVVHRTLVLNRTTLKWNRLQLPRWMTKEATFYENNFKMEPSATATMDDKRSDIL